MRASGSSLSDAASRKLTLFLILLALFAMETAPTSYRHCPAGSSCRAEPNPARPAPFCRRRPLCIRQTLVRSRVPTGVPRIAAFGFCPVFPGRAEWDPYTQTQATSPKATLPQCTMHRPRALGPRCASTSSTPGRPRPCGYEYAALPHVLQRTRKIHRSRSTRMGRSRTEESILEGNRSCGARFIRRAARDTLRGTDSGRARPSAWTSDSSPAHGHARPRIARISS